MVGVVDHGPFPGTATWGGLTSRVGDLRGLPFAVHVLVPEKHGAQTDKASGVVSRRSTYNYIFF